jgi:hypothetical protein
LFRRTPEEDNEDKELRIQIKRIETLIKKKEKANQPKRGAIKAGAGAAATALTLNTNISAVGAQIEHGPMSPAGVAGTVAAGPRCMLVWLH